MAKSGQEFIEAFQQLKLKLFFARALAASAGTSFAQPVVPKQDSNIVGIGFRPINNVLTVVFFVKKDTDAEFVRHYLESCGLEENPFTVVLTGRILAAAETGAWSRAKQQGQRLVLGGDSISKTTSESGTFGCLVRSKGEPLGLSCCHIVNPENINLVGTAEIWHPSARYGGTADHRIGVLADFKELSFEETGVKNTIDAGLFRPDDLASMSPGIRGLGTLSGVASDPPFECKVRKFGATSKLTDGQLFCKNLAHKVYFHNGRSALFDNQLAFTGLEATPLFAELGDSGSVIVDENNMAIGLLSSVAEYQNLAFGNPMHTVLEHFQAQLA